jgi:hypothetical protein
MKNISKLILVIFSLTILLSNCESPYPTCKGELNDKPVIK